MLSAKQELLMIDPRRETELFDRLAAIHQRIQWMADAEARSTWVKGWASDGHLWTEKERLIAEAERILDELEGKKS
jgi:hypothetical protein